MAIRTLTAEGRRSLDPRLPTFLVIGAAKAGTTSIYSYLAQHPDVFMSPVKEPGFFAFEGMDRERFRSRGMSITTTLEEYRSLFSGARPDQARGECSPYYLSGDKAVTERIRAHAPEARLIAILRQPIDQAFSYFLHNVRMNNLVNVTFESYAAVPNGANVEPAIALASKTYAVTSYIPALRNYFGTFSREQLLVLLYDDLVEHPANVIREICVHVGVDPAFRPSMAAKYNVAEAPRSKLVASLLGRPNPIRFAARRLLPRSWRDHGREALRAIGYRPAPRLEPEIRRRLTLRIDSQISELQDLIGRDLSHWRADAAAR